jgi:hypothetical protein
LNIVLAPGLKIITSYYFIADGRPANMAGNWQPQVSATEMEGGPIEGGPDGVKGSHKDSNAGKRKKIVIVGLGMVGISFM